MTSFGYRRGCALRLPVQHNSRLFNSLALYQIEIDGLLPVQNLTCYSWDNNGSRRLP